MGKLQKNARKVCIRFLLQRIGHFKSENKYIERFYLRLKKDKGLCKARIASARRTFMTIYYMLRNREYCRYLIERLHNKKMKEYENFLKKAKKIAS